MFSQYLSLMIKIFIRTVCDVLTHFFMYILYTCLYIVHILGLLLFINQKMLH